MCSESLVQFIVTVATRFLVTKANQNQPHGLWNPKIQGSVYKGYLTIA